MLFALLVTCSRTRILYSLYFHRNRINIPCILEPAAGKNPGDGEKTKSEDCTL
jgi:hypothetical protein